MKLRHIETFYWAAKLGSLSAAAKRLNATQSTVSMRILEFERELGVELFDRSQRSARPTVKGREMLHYAEQVLRLMMEIQERIAGTDAMPGLLRLGIVEMVSITWLPAFIKAIHEQFPKITVELDEALTNDLINRLAEGALDIILAPGNVPGYSVTPVSLGFVEFAWMASPSLGIPDRILTPRELQKWPVIALSRESYHHTSIEEWFRFGDAYCSRIDTCKSFGVAASLATAGLGVTLLPPRCYQDRIQDGSLKVIETDPPFPRLEFNATCAVESMQPVALRIAALAQEISDFDKTDTMPRNSETTLASPASRSVRQNAVRSAR